MYMVSKEGADGCEDPLCCFLMCRQGEEWLPKHISTLGGPSACGLGLPWAWASYVLKIPDLLTGKCGTGSLEGCCSSVQQVGVLCLAGGVVFLPLSGLGNQALSVIFVSAFLCFCAWETEVELSICCYLCLEMGHGGDLSLICYVPSSEPLQPTCLPPSRGCEHRQVLPIAPKRNPLSGKRL